MKIYVIHYKKLVERKKYLLEMFTKLNITDYEFIDIDRDELSMERYPNLSLFQNKNCNIAIFLSHLQAWEKIEKSEEGQGLIVEDDVIFHQNFNELFTKYMDLLPKSYDIFSIEAGCNMHIDPKLINKDQFIYRKDRVWSMIRCLAGYLISKKGIQKTKNYMNGFINRNQKINMNVDFFMAYAGIAEDMEIYWAEPEILYQGSETGVYQKSYNPY